MKKISSNIIIFILITAFLWGGVNFNFVKKANAQNLNGVANSISAPVGGGIPTVGNNSAQTATTPASTSVSKAKPWSIKTFLFKIADTAGGIVGVFTWYGWVSGALLAIGSICNLIVGIQALIFDGLLMVSMSQFGSIVDSSGIVTAWTMIRNLINVSFIFIILYIAISIILGSFGPKKKSTVAGVVISALLINYSMFITRVIIDFGNIIATAIYNTPSGAFSTGGVMQALQLQTILTPDNFLATGQINSVVLMVLQIVMVCTFMAVLFRGTLFMLGRLVALLVLIALSPIGFVGFGIPWIKDKSDEWWTALIGQVFLLPVFLFFLMMTNTMLKAAGNIIGVFNLNVSNMSTHIQSGSSLADGSSYTAFQPGQWIYFGLIIGMLHLSTKMTKSMAGKTMSDLVDRAAKGMKFAAAAVIAVGASVATGGAAAAPMAARLAGMAAKGGVTGAVGRIGMGASSFATKAAAPVAKVLKQPGLVGDLSRDLLKNTLSGVKEHTGLDIEAANKSVRDYQKNYNKFAGEEANRIGSTEDQEMEKKHREETMAGIDSRAEERLGVDPKKDELTKTLADSTKAIVDLDKDISEKDKEIEKKKKEIEAAPSRETKSELYAEQQKLESDKKELEAKKVGVINTETISKQALDEHKKDREERKKALVQQIATESGYSLEEHERRMGKINADGKFEAGEIEGEIQSKKSAQTVYVNNLYNNEGYAGKKAATAIRKSIEKGGKYEEKSDADKIIEFAKKQYEEEQKNKGGEPKKEKKEEKEEKK